jgi:hypothetical protein
VLPIEYRAILAFNMTKYAEHNLNPLIYVQVLAPQFLRFKRK